MTSAVARVEQRFVFTGVDNATDTIDAVRKSLKAAGADAAAAAKDVDKVGRSAAASVDEVKEKSGDVESALKGISDFAGSASDEVSKVGDAFGAVEAIMRLLPGPLGLAAAGVAGLTLASKLLFDLWQQNRAKLSLLTDSSTRQLGESLGFGADETVKLQGALDGLSTAARPPLAALQQVAANAERIGAEPAEAVAKFISAWEKGPEAVAALRSEIGTISVALDQLPDIATKLGLDATALGLTQAAKQGKDLEDALAGVRDAENEIAESAARQKALKDAQIKLILRGKDAELAANRRAVEYEHELTEQAKFRLQTSRDAATAIGKQQQQTLASQKALKGISDDLTLANVQADLAGNKTVARLIRIDALEEQRAALIAEQAKLQASGESSLSKQAAELLQTIQLEILRNDVQRKQLADAAKAEKEAEARQKAAEARRARQQREAERARKAAAQDAELQRVLTDWSKKLTDARDRLADADKARADTSAETARAVVDARTGELEAEAAIQQALGRADAAEAAWAAADKVRRDAEIQRINATIDARRKEARERTLAVQNDLQNDPARLDLERANAALEAADLERQRQLAIAAVQRKADDDAAKRRQERMAKERQEVVAQLSQIAQLTSQGLAQFGGEAGRVGQAASAVATGISAIGANFGDLSRSAPAAIDAVGGVAAAFVDGERSKAAVLAAMSTAKAIVLGVSGDFVGAAGNAAAAAIYAGVAGGAIGTSSAGRSAAAPAGGTTQTGGAAVGGTPEQQGATVINFNGVFATKQQVGKALTESQRSLQRTGLASVRGL